MIQDLEIIHPLLQVVAQDVGAEVCLPVWAATAVGTAFTGLAGFTYKVWQADQRRSRRMEQRSEQQAQALLDILRAREKAG